jgi:DNA-directed RNA polymerase subunit beta'
LKVINYFIQTSFKPIWLLIKYLPILPPNLRPVVELENNTVIVTDLNFLYFNILRINKLITVLKIAILMEDLIINEKVSLQYNVDKLINNEKSNDRKLILGSQNLCKFSKIFNYTLHMLV